MTETNKEIDDILFQYVDDKVKEAKWFIWEG